MMMSKWRKTTLAECVDLLAGFAFKSQHFTDLAHDIPLVKGENVSQGSILWEISKRWPATEWSALEKFQLRVGDVVVAMDRPWVPAGLKWAYIREGDPKALLVQRCARLRSKHENLDQGFLRFVIGGPGFESYVRPITTGVNVPHISGQQILAYEFALPPLPVQRRIAGILSAYDELIENSQRRIRILEEMARALYREWFVHFRFPGHEKAKLVESPLGPIPQGWEVKKLGDIAETFRGRSYRSEDLADEGGLPFLNLKCIDRDGGFRRSGIKRYVGEYKDSHIAKKGDILVAVTDMTQERRIVAHAALVPSLGNEFGVCSMDLVRIGPRAPTPKVFLYCFLRFSTFADEVKQHANGANVLHLSPERITDFRFVSPPQLLMARFADFAGASLEQIDTLENQVDSLRQTRDLLLPRLLSGQVDLAVEETAAVAARSEAAAAVPAAPVAAQPTPPTPEKRTAAAPVEVQEPEERAPAIESTDRTDVLCVIRQVFSEGGERDRDTALRDIAVALGYQRLGARIREVLTNDLTTAVRRGIVDSDNGIYRLRFRSVDDCTRDSLKESFESAIGRGWVEREEAIRTFARWAGYARTGEVIEQTTRSLINGLIRENRLETDGTRIRRVVRPD